MDLGGGSAQLAFALNDIDSKADPSTIQPVEVDNTLYDVYGKSYSQYGKNEARELVDKILLSNANGTRLIFWFLLIRLRC